MSSPIAYVCSRDPHVVWEPHLGPLCPSCRSIGNAVYHDTRTGMVPTSVHFDEFVAFCERLPIELTIPQLFTAAEIARVFDVPLELIEGSAREIHGFEGDDS